MLAPQWVELYLENVKSACLFPDVVQTLTELREIGIRQAVISATESKMLGTQLRELGISQYFEEAFGLDNIHAGSKLSLAEHWRSQHPTARVLVIGDTDHDVETAKALNADCRLVCRGHQSKEHLSKLSVSVYDTLTEVFADLKK